MLSKCRGHEIDIGWNTLVSNPHQPILAVHSYGLDHQMLGGLVCYGYGASRQMADTRLTVDRQEDATDSLFSDHTTLPNAEEWFLQADYAACRTSDSKKQHDRFARVKDVLIRLLPDIEDINVVEQNEDMLPRVEFETPYGRVRINQLGLGYRTMIAWTVDLASRLLRRYPNSPNPLAEPAVVLVDEIDLHLHPQWQRNIIRFLSDRFPNTQFIVTAHSPLVVQAAADANLVLLRREQVQNGQDYVVIENNPAAVRNWRIDQILTSDLFGLESTRPPDLDAFLTERRDLLSKGKLNDADKERLAELETRIGELPVGETPEEIEAMAISQRAAERLK